MNTERKTYSQNLRDRVLELLLPPHNLTPKEVAKQEGVRLNTLYSWVRKAEVQGKGPFNKIATTGDKFSAEQKWQIAVATDSLNEYEFSEYCRKHGLQPELVRYWIKSCKELIGKDSNHNILNKLKNYDELERKLKATERELARMESAMAQTAAYIALSKKAKAILEKEGA